MKLLSEKYFPGIHNFGWHAEAENMMWFQWKQIWKWGERNTSLEFISLRSCSADFDLNLEAVAVILSEKTNNSQQSTCTGGLRKLSHGGKWSRRHISRPLHFSHPLTGAYRTRLSIRRQDPNNYSDTETRTLSRPGVSLFELQTWDLSIWSQTWGLSIWPADLATGLDNPGFKWLPNIHCKSGVLPVIW